MDEIKKKKKIQNFIQKFNKRLIQSINTIGIGKTIIIIILLFNSLLLNILNISNILNFPNDQSLSNFNKCSIFTTKTLQTITYWLHSLIKINEK